MRNAGGVLRRRAKSDIEYFIVIFAGKKGYPRAGLLVAQEKAVTALFVTSISSSLFSYISILLKVL